MSRGTLTKYPRYFEVVVVSMTTGITDHGRDMNLRNGTIEQRRRKNIKFEQERVASLDYDVQRAGGIKDKPEKKDKPKSAKKKAQH